MSDSSIYTSVEEVRLAEQDCIARLNGSSNTEDGFGDFTTQGKRCAVSAAKKTCTLLKSVDVIAAVRRRQSVSPLCTQAPFAFALNTAHFFDGDVDRPSATTRFSYS